MPACGQKDAGLDIGSMGKVDYMKCLGSTGLDDLKLMVGWIANQAWEKARSGNVSHPGEGKHAERVRQPLEIEARKNGTPNLHILGSQQ